MESEPTKLEEKVGVRILDGTVSLIPDVLTYHILQDLRVVVAPVRIKNQVPLQIRPI